MTKEHCARDIHPVRLVQVADGSRNCLLEDREGGMRARIHSGLSRLLVPCTLAPWRTVLDGAVFLLLLICIVQSVRITANSASTSTCKTTEAPVALKVVILLLPPCMIAGVSYASYVARYAAGAQERAALALPQMVFGVVLAEWMAICACGLNAGAVLMFGTVVVAVLVGVCTSDCVAIGG